MKFNLMVLADCDPTSDSRGLAIDRQVDRAFDPSRNDTKRSDWVMRLRANGVEETADAPSGDSGNARTITTAAVSRAGAIEIRSEPPTGQSAS